MPAEPTVRYLDNHATTRTDPRVIEAMLPFFGERFGNAASTGHAFGDDAAGAVQAARKDVAELVGARPEEVIFTSGGTESTNLALFGFAVGEPGTVLMTAGEHPATSS